MDEVEIKVKAIDYHCKSLEKERQMLVDRREDMNKSLQQEIKAQEKAFFELEGIRALTAP